MSLPGTLTAIVSIQPASAVIESGQIVERGCHSVLLAAGGRYADLYQGQFRDSPDGLSAA